MRRFIYHFIGRNRRNVIVRYLNRMSSFFRHAYNNKDFNHLSNGEYWVQKRLTGLKMKTVFDVGANIGLWTLNALKVFNGCSIHCFEPIPAVFQKLRANLSGSEAILVNAAFSDQEGDAVFNYYPTKDVFSSRFDFKLDAVATQVAVTMQTGDDYCRRNGVTSIDFLKVDTEGSDHLVLRGFDELLSGQKIRVIQFEYGALAITTKFLLKDFYDFFSERGYIVGKIYPNYVDFSPYTYEKEDFIGLNFLAVQRNDSDVISLLDTNCKRF